MAFTTTTNLPLKLPVPGSREPAQIALINENMVAVDAHDHTTGKAVAVGRLRSGLQANRPAAGQAGNVYFATDTGKFYVDSGAAWVEFLTTGGTSTITGWTLVDPIIRDTIQFGPEPTGTPDATLSRTGAGALRVDNFLGIGVNIQTNWGGDFRGLQFGAAGTLTASISHTGLNLTSNTYLDGSTNRALMVGPATHFQLYNGELNVYTAASFAAGAQQAFTQRLKIANTGTLTLTPDAGQDALVLSSSSAIIRGPAPITIVSNAGDVYVAPRGGASGGYLMPSVDNATNLGNPSARWGTIYSSVGSINTSSREAKEGITPLDPLACYQAAKDVRWYEFAYLPPAYQEPEPPPDIAYDAADDNETKAEKKARRDEAEAASKAAHLKMVAETAPARHQRGFVFPAGADAKDEAGGALPPVPDLFGLSDRESTTPQADIATLGAALQHLIQKVEALEAASGQAPAA